MRIYCVLYGCAVYAQDAIQQFGSMKIEMKKKKTHNRTHHWKDDWMKYERWKNYYFICENKCIFCFLFFFFCNANNRRAINCSNSKNSQFITKKYIENWSNTTHCNCNIIECPLLLTKHSNNIEKYNLKRKW